MGGSLKDSATLKSLAQQLKGKGEERAREEAARAKAEAERIEREKQAAAEATIFRSTMKGVNKLPESNRYVPQAPKPVIAAAPAGPKRKLTAAEQKDDDAAVLRESLSDLFEVDHYMEEDPSLNYLAPGVGSDVMKRLRKGYWPVQDELDLHGLRRDDARDAIAAFLRRANQRNQRCVCVIHGRGFGSKGGEPVLKSMVHSWLVQTEGVIAFCQAHPMDGGEGALIVLLRAALRPER
ncbi:DNA-nicking Smr family endonuclease [Pseudoduganella flava]|uniref:DNA mismatch repair protein MutS n=1 Tax=Pseudoduganella flava TaxID=871742 RepID=A0A562PDQ6_9BURK|nr:Smr/MutS family protein [Pseudoduganella flava]QGZ42094.1 DNA mismatch repair protein MutS [Pseudoduganella flava]TWI42538.1 DNA-nicking Smr family endonuclease [Pseudoduganella flava]